MEQAYKSRNKYLLKYTVDKIIAVSLVILFSPLIITILIAIWVEGFYDNQARGAPFYMEERISQGKPFALYKFRTLKMPVIKKMKKTDSATFMQYETNNVTCIGKLLIKFYLDELPQLLNVITGKMSMIGPRPRIPRIYQENMKSGYKALKFLRAGISGLHQLSKGEQNFSLERSEEYCRKAITYSSFALLGYDISIMIKTIFKILKAEGL